jgi:hypothetical protein
MLLYRTRPYMEYCIEFRKRSACGRNRRREMHQKLMIETQWRQ